MNSYVTNPSFFRIKTLLSLEISEVDSLARKAVGSLTSFRLLLGRCLLAMRERKGFKKFGCSSEIHYSVCRLGLSEGVAGDCRRVARDLVGLPNLTLAAEQGTIEWGKLREVSRKASPETEALWIKLCGDLNYKQIEKLVAKTPKGGVPGDVFEDAERPTTEFRCRMSEEVLAMLDRARRMYSLEQDRAVTTVEVLEWALASYISSQPVGEESLEKVRLEMDRDLQAEKAREIPLVAHAREVAVEMGCVPISGDCEVEDEDARAGESGQEGLARSGNAVFLSGSAVTDFNQGHSISARTGTFESESPSVEGAAHRSCSGSQQLDNHCCGQKTDGLELAAARANSEYLEALKDTLSPIQNKAGWLDFHEGWHGEREDSYRMRWGRGDWSVFEKSS